MAQRRMFSKEITNSSDFLMMSQSAQSLYFHIGMNADDDGFCEVFTVMRMTDSKPDDLSVLHAKGFIFVHDSKVCIVKDWHKNNLIRKDRYSPSKYLEDDNLKKIYFTIMDEKVRKLEQYSDIKVNGKPVVNQRLPQYSIGKDSIGKNILSSNDDCPFVFKDKINSLLSSKDWRMPIIANYWQYRGISFENKDQYQAGLKRELRAVAMLKGYDLDRIKKTMFHLNTQSDWLDRWSLETVHKFIDKLK